MLITKGKPKLKLENASSKKIAIFYRFWPKLYQAPFNNSVVMITMDAQFYWFVFEIDAYQYIVKVTKFELLTAYRFSSAEGRTRLWAAFLPPPPRLFKIKAWFPFVLRIDDSRYWDSYDYCNSQDSQVHTHRKNRRQLVASCRNYDWKVLSPEICSVNLISEICSGF